MKLRHLVIATIMLVSFLAGALAPPPSFKDRWPKGLPAAMSLEAYLTARKASERPSFCEYAWYGACRLV
jgi:hypothetical protein